MSSDETGGKDGTVVYHSDDDTTHVLPATASTWFKIYVEGPALDSSTFHKMFRRRFKMPYAQYLEIAEKCKSSERFQCWSDPDTPGNNAAPLELLVLACLKRLGKGWSFDELSENTFISCEVIRTFFNTFIEFQS